MTRTLQLTLVLMTTTALIAGIEATQPSPQRTLTTMELWNTRGSDPIPGRQCDTIPHCLEEDSCSPYHGTGLPLCATVGQEAETYGVNTDGCQDYTGNPDDQCIEGTPPNVCVRFWKCKVDEHEGCVKDCNANANSPGANPIDKKAPDLCEMVEDEE